MLLHESISKAVTRLPETNDLMAAMDRYTKLMERRVRRAYLAAISDSLKRGQIAALLQGLAAGQVPYSAVSITQALEAIDEKLTPLVTLIRDTTMGGGKVTGRIMTPRLGVSFDPTNRLAVDAARTNAARMVTQVNRSTREAIREMVVSALQSGDPPYELAERLRSAIGLTKEQARAVMTYRNSMLETGMARGRANSLAKSYADRLLEHRASVIARTETMTAANTGQLQYWRQAREAGAIDSSRMMREWIATDDEKRTCPQCRSMDGELAPIDGRFHTGDEGPPIHPQCRCTTGLVFTDSLTKAQLEYIEKFNPYHDQAGRFASANASGSPSYGGMHQPTKGPPVYDLLLDEGEGSMLPDDVYDHPEWYTGYTEPQFIRETMAQLRSVRGNPDALVTIYRGAPPGVNAFDTGNWVSLSKQYAIQHGYDPADPAKDWPVYSARVPARHVRFAGDDLMEFGYWGQSVPTDRVAKFNPFHDRIGRFASGPGGGGMSIRSEGQAEVSRGSGGRTVRAPKFHNATAADKARLAKEGYRVPPAWTNVQIPYKREKIVAKGIDVKGRQQYLYSKEHSASASADKFRRVHEFHKGSDILDIVLKQDYRDPVAGAVILMRRMGLRVGSNRDTKAEKKATGASNLQARHVKIAGNKATLSFTGKKGVNIRLSTTDPEVVRTLKYHMRGKSGTQEIFGTNAAETIEYIRGATGIPTVKNHDLRTAFATAAAHDRVRSMPVPTTTTARRRARLEVGDYVSSLLGNNRTEALNSYIAPEVFSPWEV